MNVYYYNTDFLRDYIVSGKSWPQMYIYTSNSTFRHHFYFLAHPSTFDFIFSAFVTGISLVYLSWDEGSSVDRMQHDHWIRTCQRQHFSVFGHRRSVLFGTEPMNGEALHTVCLQREVCRFQFDSPSSICCDLEAGMLVSLLGFITKLASLHSSTNSMRLMELVDNQHFFPSWLCGSRCDATKQALT